MEACFGSKSIKIQSTKKRKSHHCDPSQNYGILFHKYEISQENTIVSQNNKRQNDEIFTGWRLVISHYYDLVPHNHNLKVLLLPFFFFY